MLDVKRFMRLSVLMLLYGKSELTISQGEVVVHGDVCVIRCSSEMVISVAIAFIRVSKPS